MESLGAGAQVYIVGEHSQALLALRHFDYMIALEGSKHYIMAPAIINDLVIALA